MMQRMSAPPLLLLIHIPKTAGTTLSRMIRLRLALWPPAHWMHHADVLGHYHVGYSRPNEVEHRCGIIRALPLTDQHRVQFFAAHAGFGLHELLPDPSRVQYITMLRDPVSRVLSTYQFLCREGSLPGGMSLQRFVECGRHFRPFYADNAQVRFLAGERGRVIDSPPGTCTGEMLDRALHRLEHDIVLAGLTERFDESLLLLGHLLRWHMPLYASARVKPNPGLDSRVPDSAIEAIRSANALDLALYQRGATLLEQKIAAAGAEFAGELARFSRANRPYQALFGPLMNGLPSARRVLRRMHVVR